MHEFDLAELPLDVVVRGQGLGRSIARDLEGHPRAPERRAELVADRGEELALLDHDARVDGDGTVFVNDDGVDVQLTQLRQFADHFGHPQEDLFQ